MRRWGYIDDKIKRREEVGKCWITTRSARALGIFFLSHDCNTHEEFCDNVRKLPPLPKTPNDNHWGPLRHVHPLTHFAEVSGCHFYQYNRPDYSLLRHQGELLRVACEALDTMNEEDDLLAYAQAQICISMAVMNVGSFKIVQVRHGISILGSFRRVWVGTRTKMPLKRLADTPKRLTNVWYYCRRSCISRHIWCFM